MGKSYYHTCPDCGANLDPGERCDCTKATERPGGAATPTEPRPQQSSEVYHSSRGSARPDSETELYRRAAAQLNRDLDWMVARGISRDLVDRDPAVRHVLTLAWAMELTNPVHGLDQAIAIARATLEDKEVSA